MLKSCNMALENELKAAKIQLHQLQSDRIQIIEEKENQAANHIKTLQVCYFLQTGVCYCFYKKSFQLLFKKLF